MRRIDAPPFISMCFSDSRYGRVFSGVFREGVEGGGGWADGGAIPSVILA